MAGRKPTPPALPVVVEMDGGAIAHAAKARDELALIDQTAADNTRELAVRLGYDGPLEPDLLQHGIAHGMRRTVDACLDMGRMLLLLKERVGHGEFQKRVAGVGLAPRAAQKFMQAALKLSNAPYTAHLAKAIGTQGKLLELLVLDDGEIKELGEKGSTLGITVDDIDAMGQVELRKALREARADGAAKDKLIETKNKKIDKLSLFKPAAGAIERNVEERNRLAELKEATEGADLHFRRLAVIVGTIYEGDSQALQLCAQQAVQYVATLLGQILEENGVTDIDLTAAVQKTPAWLQGGAEG